MGRRITIMVLAVALLAAGGCAGRSGGAGPGGSVAEDGVVPSAEGEVVGQGLVLQRGDDAPVLCLGAVAASDPPQCGGPEVVGWDWSAAEQWGDSGGVRSGSYAVQGTWDGEALVITQPPIPLSLFDVMPVEDPREDPANAGAGDESELARIQEELTGEAPGFVMSGAQNGYLFVDVVFDDGALQQSYDERFGERLVAVRSALRPVG